MQSYSDIQRDYVPLHAFPLRYRRNIMDIRIILTADGSHSLHVDKLDEIYHSTNGAITESEHVFLRTGFDHVHNTFNPVELLEVGFGTGLNALLTAMESLNKNLKVNYSGLEPYPIKAEIITKLNYPGILEGNSAEIWNRIHGGEWNTWVEINPNFKLLKSEQQLEFYTLPQNHYNLIYFDAFSPPVQPELWSEDIFRKLFDSLQKGGTFVTYSARGSVRRNLQSAGFVVERLPGPPGKREMLRAYKPNV